MPAFDTLSHHYLPVSTVTGFSLDTHQYFMKASPVRPTDYLEFFAEIDLVGCLSACPCGDCSTGHSDDKATCYPLKIEVFKPREETLEAWSPPSVNGYTRTHGP